MAGVHWCPAARCRQGKMTLFWELPLIPVLAPSSARGKVPIAVI